MLPAFSFLKLCFFLLFTPLGTLGVRGAIGISGNSRELSVTTIPTRISVFSHNQAKVRDIRKDEVGAQKALDCVFALLDQGTAARKGLKDYKTFTEEPRPGIRMEHAEGSG